MDSNSLVRRAISVVAAVALMLAGLSFILYLLESGGPVLFLISGTTLLIVGYHMIRDAIQSPQRHPDL